MEIEIDGLIYCKDRPKHYKASVYVVGADM